MEMFRETEILKLFKESKRENMTIADCMDISAASNREIYIPQELVEDMGAQTALVIRYWNRVDDDENIPAELRRPIIIYLDCNGGNLVDAFTIVDAIRGSKTPVYTVVTGSALSGGFLIAISGHKRIAYPHSQLLFHEGSGGFSGDANKFGNFASFYKKQLEQMKDIVLSSTKITEDKYKEIQYDDYWMTAETALELGCIDEIGVM